MFTIIQKIGEFSPLLLFILSSLILRKKSTLLFYYILFFGVSLIVNLVLKGIIQQPRPSINMKIFDLMMKNKERFIYKHGIPYDIFGMPSGHAQSALFSTVFIYLSLHDIKLTLLFLIISIIALYQRVIDNHHTINQVIFGSIVGCILGFVAYKMARINIEGKKSIKVDDFGPV
jgi:membrane-associated phospholipid phosphatase